jgi:DNA (cytosine-5)-methyltransferase 1
MIRIGSLYSGIGGLEIGLLAAFAEVEMQASVTWQCEIDPFCRRVLAHHFPDTQRFSDVKDVSHPPTVELLCGGFMCTDVSAAGKGAGLGIDTRSGFTLHHLLRIIDEITPQWLVIENVASGAKRWLPNVVQELRSRGYRPYAIPLGAVDVGAPHRRLRVFVVAHHYSLGCEGKRSGRLLNEEQTLRNDTNGCHNTNVSDTECLRNEQGRRSRAGRADTNGARNDGQDMGDSANSRRERPDWHERTRRPEQSKRPSNANGNRRAPKPSMGDITHGLPFNVAGHRWPAGRGEPQEAWEPPRSLPSNVRHFDRPAKLRALGNAVVPQCSLVIGRILIHMMKGEQHGHRQEGDHP